MPTVMAMRSTIPPHCGTIEGVTMEFGPAIVAAAFVAFALASRRLSRTAITGPMVFVTVGLVLGPEVLDLFQAPPELDIIDLLLEGTLVVVLFTDASAVSSSDWRQEAAIPGRLLAVGLPLTIGAGWALAGLLFSDLNAWEAAILGTMLAPTDAALGKAVVSNPRVPQRVRQALNVESGLNDGIALPVFVVFLEAARAAEQSLDLTDFVEELIPEVGVAVLVGVAVGGLGALVVRRARDEGSASAYWLQIAFVALAVLAFAVADPLGGSGFIAAWVAGATFGRVRRETEDELHEFAEETGDVLTMLSFLVFGLALGTVLTEATWEMVLYGVLSLAVIRVAAVFVAMIGSGLEPVSVLYLGWFGPRGLATLILTLSVVDATELDGAATISGAALIAVGLSVFAHGATAWWGSNTYADWIEARPEPDDLEEAEDVPHVRLPRRSRPGSRARRD
jgi:NhaP-type Na+/H+ or K+/H+ antiporter